MWKSSYNALVGYLREFRTTMDERTAERRPADRREASSGSTEQPGVRPD